jgi:DnaK suppressor protein
MQGMRERLEEELIRATDRLRQMARGALEEASGATTATLGDEADESVASEEREMRFGARHFLVERVTQIRGALQRLAEGRYGVCVDCGEAISPARLRALPEVETCIRCQDRRERLRRRQGDDSVAALHESARRA